LENILILSSDECSMNHKGQLCNCDGQWYEPDRSDSGHQTIAGYMEMTINVRIPSPQHTSQW